MSKEEFNIFGSINTRFLNENAHSLFLKRLLSPSGNHDLNLFFLKSFVMDVLNCPFDESLQWSVETEITAGKGRVDIYIHSKEHSIVIENKTGAQDQESQLYRYWRNKIYGKDMAIYDKQYAAERWESCNLVYLTRDGQKPSEKAIKRPYDSGGKYDTFPEILPLEKIICISYKQDISAWIKNCLKAISEKEKPRLYSALEQYKEWIDLFY